MVLFDLALDFAACSHVAVARSEQASDGELAQAIGLMQAAGINVSVIDDFPGLLLMRTVCMLANEAAEVVHTGVASAEAVDQAMRLGVNYPRGPLAWAEAIGLERVRDVLDHLARTYGEDRYRASWLLRRKALAKHRSMSDQQALAAAVGDGMYARDRATQALGIVVDAIEPGLHGRHRLEASPWHPRFW